MVYWKELKNTKFLEMNNNISWNYIVNYNYFIINNLKNVKNDVKKVCGISKNVWIGIKYIYQ